MFSIGQKIQVKEFNFTNLSGGTGSSDAWNRGEDERFNGVANLIITKVWNDYETGIKGWAMPDPKDKKLIEFLKRNCKQGYVKISEVPGQSYIDSEWIEEEGTFVVYWSQWYVV